MRDELWLPAINMRKSNNPRMLQQLVFDTQQIIKATTTQDIDLLPLVNNDHASELELELDLDKPCPATSPKLSFR